MDPETFLHARRAFRVDPSDADAVARLARRVLPAGVPDAAEALATRLGALGETSLVLTDVDVRLWYLGWRVTHTCDVSRAGLRDA